MIWLLWKLITLPLRLAVGTTKLGVKTGYRTGRLLGYRRLFVLMIGIVIGLLIAPVPGAKLREKLQQRFGQQPPRDLADQVRFELSHSPRTWHLPQPDIEVIGGRVVLHGDVPHDTGRADLEAAASSVDGVTAVDNRLHVTTAS